MLAAKNEVDLLRRFTDFTVEPDFPDLATRQPGLERYAVAAQLNVCHAEMGLAADRSTDQGQNASLATKSRMSPEKEWRPV